MIDGLHVLLYSSDPEADRAFFRDILEFPAVDAGHGWLIFALPPSELAVHPATETFVQSHAGHALLGAVPYLMCKDLRAVMQALQVKNIACTEVNEAPWGMKTTVKLPSGGEIGLYQPAHPMAIHF